MTDSTGEPINCQLAENKVETTGVNKKLHAALDRFEQNRLEVVNPGSKLSLRSLALEAGVNKDTPFSRYKKDTPFYRKYRYPEIVSRFNEIKNKLTKETKNKTSEIEKQKALISNYESKFLQQARVINQQDERIVELERYSRELEAQIKKLKQEALKLVKYDN